MEKILDGNETKKESEDQIYESDRKLIRPRPTERAS